MQLDRIAIRILELNLTTARACLDLVAKDHLRLAQPLDGRRQILHVEHDAIPASRLLRSAIWQYARTGAARPAEQQGQRAARDGSERTARSELELESEMLGIERNGSCDILHVIANGCAMFRNCVCHNKPLQVHGVHRACTSRFASWPARAQGLKA